MSDADLVLTDRRGAVAVLTVNRPEKRNALSGAVKCSMLGALDQVARDTTVRAVVITGAGDKAFVAGADVAEFEGRTPVDQYRVMKAPSVYDAIERLAKPVIAAINGYCLGGGLELALACDIRVAAETATFGQPEVNLGIIPGNGATQRLPRVVGLGAALKLILTGDRIDAAEALRLRLVDEVVSPGTELDRALALGATIATRSPVAVAAAKEATRAALNVALTDGLKLETALFQLCFASEDKKEGVRAFLEKRAPGFEGR